MGYSPWGRKESEMTEHTHTFVCQGQAEGSGSSSSDLQALDEPP